MCIHIHAYFHRCIYSHSHISTHVYTHINVYTHVNTSMNTYGSVYFMYWYLVLCTNKVYTYIGLCVGRRIYGIYVQSLSPGEILEAQGDKDIFLRFKRERLYFPAGEENQTSTSLRPLKLEGREMPGDHCDFTPARQKTCSLKLPPALTLCLWKCWRKWHNQMKTEHFKMEKDNDQQWISQHRVKYFLIKITL